MNLEILNNKLRTIVLVVIIAICLLVVAFFVYRQFFQSEDDIVKSLILSKDQVDEDMSYIKELKELDLEILEDERFEDMKDVEFQLPDVEDLEVGKKNPFLPD